MKKRKRKENRINKLILRTQNWMRYDDVGDYYITKENNLYITAYKNKSMPCKYVYGILLHELIEALILYFRRVPFKAIDAIDTENTSIYSREKLKKYKRQYDYAHNVALKVEKILMRALHIKWKKYDDYIERVRVKIK